MNHRKCRVLFVGGSRDGQVHEVTIPLPRDLRVAVEQFQNMTETTSEIPTHSYLPQDDYRLEPMMDRTGIPQLVYRLRAMVRRR